MMTKKPTKKVYKLAYTFFITVSVLLCMAFIKPNSVSELIPTIIETEVFNDSKPSIFPIKTKNQNDITLEHGMQKKHTNKEKKHNGIDIKAPKGTPVIATADGVIVKASHEKSWGKIIVIKHPDNYQTRYAHLNDFNVKEKQSVKKGKIIGFVGNTGSANKAHLHYEVLKNNKQQNPKYYIIK